MRSILRAVIRPSALACALLCASAGCADGGATPPAPDATNSTMPSQPTARPSRSASGYDVAPLPPEKVKELASRLDPEAYRITQRAGTEPAFCGNLLDNKKAGTYACVVCGLPLFSSEHKFNSGTGWPSFHSPVDPAHVSEKSDASHGMVRTEINCARCGAHLGHVFDDGPRPTGMRYCLNSAALRFYDKGTLPADGLTKDPTGLARGEAAASGGSASAAQPAASPAAQVAYFGGGCFWGIEHWFSICPGVASAESGYMGGRTKDPTYKQVCYDDTGHAEVVKVTFDPAKVTYRQLLEGFFMMHDPTQLNRQGPDVGDQYRSAIFCTTPGQAAAARAFIDELAKAGSFGGKKVVTQVVEGGTFYAAEDYHQDYVAKTGRACHGTNPWPQVFGTAKGAAGAAGGH
jgi:peptide methionine sulfoxide reductase msrA/msrB